ncbi:MAG: macro domain-containing protein [Candidatus Paceibacterota bacterium]
MRDENDEINKALVNVRKLPTIQIVSGDITQIDADCIITPINSQKNWHGGIDRAIYAIAGEMYHDQIRKTHLENLFSAAVLGNRKTHRGKFDHVVFVVDDLRSRAREVINRGLETADEAGFETILIPAIRTGVFLGIIERTPDEIANEYILGILKFLRSNRNSGIKSIKLVIFRNEQFKTILEDKITSVIKNMSDKQ